MREIQDAIALHQSLIGIDLKEMSNQQKVKYISDLTLAAHVELTEMLQELPWKPWKDFYDQIVNVRNAHEELADVFIFLFDIANILEHYLVNRNIKEVILEKIQMNTERLNNGDHTQHKNI